MTSAFKFRHDLTVIRHDTAEGIFFVVKDPVAGAFFRFGQAEEFIFRQLDGETSLDVIRSRAEAEFGATLPVETLGAFIERLEKSGLLETGTKKKTQPARPKRVRGNLLYIRFNAFDPSRILNRLAPHVSFFTPYFVFFSAVMILMAAGILVSGWEDFLRDAAGLYRLSAIPPVIGTVFLVIALHEFAHSLTCKRFGGEVREMGFMLIYSFRKNRSGCGWVLPGRISSCFCGPSQRWPGM
jgi:putative peptide zinc metalloprotease protein